LKRARGSKTSVSRRVPAPKSASGTRSQQNSRPTSRPSSARPSSARSSSGMPANSRLQDRRVKKKKKKNTKVWRILGITGIAVLSCLCIALVVVIAIGAGMYKGVEKEIANIDFEALAYNYSSIVYATDKDGNPVEVEYLHNDGNREWIDNDKIPQVAKDAAVSIEDERFYEHNGVDFKRTTGAVFGWVGAKITGGSPSYGGSTITQQVIKNITNEKDKTVTRKVKEMMRAIAFEKRFTKEEILAAYLNIAYFGNQCYGIEAAAKMYFSKNAIDLTLPEAAMIVGITQAPTRFDPFKNPENALTKRNTVLKKMYELKKISKEEYQEAVASPLGVNENRGPNNAQIYNYFVDQVISDVIADLQQQKGYSYAFASSQVFGGGLKIYTTMDSDVQSAMEEVYQNTANFPLASKGVQSAMVIIDPATGEIKGMVGGIGAKTESRGLNRATQSTRQPGSSTKPISVYGPALEDGTITAATVITDSALTIKDTSGTWTPKNPYSGFKGDMTVRKAIEISANIPAVKTLQKLGLEKSYDFMTNKLGITSLTRADRNSLSALSLGGMSKGVSPEEMAGAYAVFANNGVYIEPHTYTKVVDHNGKVILENKPVTRRAMSEENAYIMTRFLKDVVNGSAGTGRSARLASMPTYGKTGTSNENNDKWFCGFTPYYVGTVWYGYDNNGSVGGSNISAQVWKKVMEKVHEGLPVKDFDQPDDITVVSVCQLTGKLSSSGCVHGKNEYFAKGTLPESYCGNKHGGVVGETGDDPGEVTEPTTTDDPGEVINPDPTATPTETPKPTTEPSEPQPRPSKNPEIGEEPDDGVISLD